MKRRNVPRLAAAFVVTIAAGCAESPPQPPEHPNPPGPPIIHKQPDGTCAQTFDGNPPYDKPVPCPEAGDDGFATPPSGTGSATPSGTGNPALPSAPSGWKVEPNQDGTCTAYGPDPCNHPGCNPPPPMRVTCPPGMKPPS